MSEEVYFLSSLDSTLFSTTRRCAVIKRMVFDTGKECMLVRLSPPVLGEVFSSREDLETFVLAGRHEGQALPPATEFPCFVFIARPLIDAIEVQDVIEAGQLQVVAWGELYRSQHDADHHVFNT